ncbi:hypothetical protein [Ktedonospora formicarum]|nr:hypothetical protein [Ktedonospora formicarum]
MDKRVKQHVLEYLKDLCSEERASIQSLELLMSYDQEEMLFAPLIAALQQAIVEAKHIIVVLEQP